jgi:hypothetical protein
MDSIITDIRDGRMVPTHANAMIAAARVMLRNAELQVKYGQRQPGQTATTPLLGGNSAA